MPKIARIETAGGTARRALGLRAALTLGAAMALAATLPPAASAQATGRSDIVVLLDSSRSMLPYYSQVVDFVVTGVLRDYARSGDTFHLLSFSDTAQLEIAQPLRTQADVQSALARLYLLYPVAKSTDLVGALRYLLQYLAKLPEAGDKHIVLITDGMHSPPPGSSNATMSADEVRAELEKAAGRIRERGWTLRIVRVPFDGQGLAGAAPGAGGQAGGGASVGVAEPGADSPSAGDYLDSLAAAAGVAVSSFDPADASTTLNDAVSIVAVGYPDSLGERERNFKLPLELRNPSSAPVDIEAVALLLEDGYDALGGKAFLRLAPGASGTLQLSVELPAELEQGELTLRVEPRFSGGLRASPPYGAIRLVLKESALAAFLRGGSRVLIFALLLVALLALALLVAAYLRGLHRRASDSVVEAVLDSNEAAESRRAADARASPRSAGAISPTAPAAGAPSRPAAAVSASPPDRRESAQALLSTARSSDSAAAQAATLAGASGQGESSERAAALAAAARSSSGAASNAASAERLGAAARKAESPASRALELLGAAGDAAKAKGASGSEAPLAAVAFTAGVKRPGSLRLSLHVRDQNPYIGKRNIKTVHAGGRKSVGGGSSDFLVFLYPTPRRIAELYYDGESLTLIPLKRSYFPDYDRPIEDCLGKELRMVNARGRELWLRFERYVPPVESLNRLLHCIDAPGASGEAGDEA